MIAMNASCPCGSVAKYKKCCGVYHRGALAPDAVTLMRSRYSAYAACLPEYIMRTTHPQCPQFEPDTSAWAASIAHFCRSTQFLKLDILAVAPTRVTFRATLKRGGRDTSFCETSDFVQEGGRWLYRSGEVT